MLHSMMQKTVVLYQPQAILNNGAATIATLDTKGFAWVDIYVLLGATDVSFSVLKLQNSDTDGSYADLTNSIFGTALLQDGVTTSLLPTGTDDNKIFGWHLDMKALKRWLKVLATVGNSTGAYLTVVAVMSRANQVPNSATTRGLAEEILVKG